jgi:allophanate hydrolase subunit 2
VGGLGGRALRAGDRVPVAAAGPPPRRPRALSPSIAPAYGGEVVLRAVVGPQDDRFTPRGLDALLGGAYAVTPANDRMGYRLEGAPVEHAAGADVLSDALCPGAVQVPASGQPIVMAVDAQTTGGYAKVATVIGPDLARLAQARQGDRVRFSAVSDAEAVAALREEREALARLAAALGG